MYFMVVSEPVRGCMNNNFRKSSLMLHVELEKKCSENLNTKVFFQEAHVLDIMYR